MSICITDRKLGSPGRMELGTLGSFDQLGALGSVEGAGITDRDLGDENRVVVVDARMPWQKQIDAQSADIATLESALREKDDMLAATYAELHEARRQIEMYRAALKELQAKAAMTVPEGSFY